MNTEEFKNKALTLSKSAFAIGKRVTAEAGKAALVVGKEITKEVVGSVQVVANHIEARADRKARFEFRKGTYHSAKIFPDAFESVETVLRQPIGEHRYNVQSDASQGQIRASVSWEEFVHGFSNTHHQLDLTLNFVPELDGSTKVTFDWIAVDFPKGFYTNQLLRTANMWVSAALEAEIEPDV